jgi:outer membrane lipoprotein SlyB
LGQEGWLQVKRPLLTSLSAFPLLIACTTDPYTGRPDLGSRITAGVLLGAAAGALGGRAAGMNPVEGAAAGMIAGGTVGAATNRGHRVHRRFYKDTRGYCYYIDEAGQPQYDYNVRC